MYCRSSRNCFANFHLKVDFMCQKNWQYAQDLIEWQRRKVIPIVTLTCVALHISFLFVVLFPLKTVWMSTKQSPQLSTFTQSAQHPSISLCGRQKGGLKGLSYPFFAFPVHPSSCETLKKVMDWGLVKG